MRKHFSLLASSSIVMASERGRKERMGSRRTEHECARVFVCGWVAVVDMADALMSWGGGGGECKEQ